MPLQELCAYENKTKIPDHLKPLPEIKFEVYRKYRLDFYTPKSLVELCCLTIGNWECKNYEWGREGIQWIDLESVLANSKKIEGDSCYRLCNPKSPARVSVFLKERAAASNTSIFNLLKTLRIIMDETVMERTYYELINHWGKIPAGQPKYPCVIFGTNSKPIKDRLRNRPTHGQHKSKK